MTIRFNAEGTELVAEHTEVGFGGAEVLLARCNRITERVIGAAIEVHSTLGPGLLESMYERALAHELSLRGLAFARQHPVTLHYKCVCLGPKRIDLVVENLVVIELKAVSEVHQVHKAQLLTYLRAGNWPVGLLLNFNTTCLKDGISRKINRPALASPTASLPLRSQDTTRRPLR